MLSKEDKQVINEFLIELKKELIKSHISYGQRASGSFIKGLEVVNRHDGGQLIDNAGTSDFLEYGRRPTRNSGSGSGSLVDAIKRWMNQKGLAITKRFNPYSITAKIHSEGTFLYRQFQRTGSGSGVITSVINDNAMESLFEKLSITSHANIFSEVSKELTI